MQKEFTRKSEPQANIFSFYTTKCGKKVYAFGYAGDGNDNWEALVYLGNLMYGSNCHQYTTHWNTATEKIELPLMGDLVKQMAKTQNDLIKLFVDGAGFRNCSRQQIWKCSNIQAHTSDFSGLSIRPFKNSDSTAISNLYNDNLLTHFRPSLTKNKKEFQEKILHGLTDSNEFKYIIENHAERLIIGYFTLKTSDNKNYLLDLTLNKGYEHIFERVLNYSLKLAQKRTKDLNFYVINKYYTQNAAGFEHTLKELGYTPSTSSVVLVKDLFRTVKEENFIKEAMLYTDINSNPAFH